MSEPATEVAWKRADNGRDTGLRLRPDGRDDGCGRLEHTICISSAGVAPPGAMVDCGRMEADGAGCGRLWDRTVTAF